MSVLLTVTNICASSANDGRWWDSGGSDNDVAAYQEALKAFLKKNGPVALSKLGGAVKRPPKAPKLKKLLEDSKAFIIKGDTVSLA